MVSADADVSGLEPDVAVHWAIDLGLNCVNDPDESGRTNCLAVLPAAKFRFQLSNPSLGGLGAFPLVRVG